MLLYHLLTSCHPAFDWYLNTSSTTMDRRYLINSSFQEAGTTVSSPGLTLPGVSWGRSSPAVCCYVGGRTPVMLYTDVSWNACSSSLASQQQPGLAFKTGPISLGCCWHWFWGAYLEQIKFNFGLTSYWPLRPALEIGLSRPSGWNLTWPEHCSDPGECKIIQLCVVNRVSSQAK